MDQNDIHMYYNMFPDWRLKICMLIKETMEALSFD